MIGKVSLAASMATLTEIGHQITWCHNGFSFVNNSGGCNAGGSPQGL